MVQIVKKKKKGRPSKSDLAGRGTAERSQPERDLRRSHRRRSVRYNIDYDDYVDEDDDDDEDDERRREKKLKLVLKLQHSESAGESAPSRTRRDGNESGASASSSEYGNKPPKKRRIGGEDDDEYGDGDNDDEDDEGRGRNADSKGPDSVPGTPAEVLYGTPMPDKKSLELILDKLQKKDIYGVYAEPVDPEELPDYHDVIEHPMDFATVRKKLGNGSYCTFEQFESDVFLICTNAMQYNAPDTIYYKQARTIQELARKKFQKLRFDIERTEKELKAERSEKELKLDCSEKELNLERLEKELKPERSEKELKPERSEKDIKSEQKMRSSPLVKKQIKKPVFRTAQEPVGSDFSSGATLATMGDVQNGFNATQASGCERPSNIDGLILESNSSQIDNNLEKAEEPFSGGKGLLSKFGRKPFVLDENRRATYNTSNQPIVGPDTIFNTFEAETKQLVAVGLHADHSYARSLSRFAATLGPVAWKVASQRIEQALPAGTKFGRGWVGEFEPLPTPVLMLETRIRKEPSLVTKFQHNTVLQKNDKTSRPTVPAKEHSFSGPTLEGKQSLFCPASAPTSERKQSMFGSAGGKSHPPINTSNQQQNPPSRNFTRPEKKVLKHVELNCPPSASQNNAELVSEKQLLNGSEAATPKLMEAASRNRNILHSLPFKLPDTNGVVGGLANGKASSNRTDGNKSIASASDTVPGQMSRPPTYHPHGAEQGISDPVHMMRKLAEKTQNQQKSSSHSPVNSPPAMPSVPSPRSDSSNASATAARAWMSIGAGGFKPVVENSNAPKNHISADSLYNPTRELHPQVTRFRGEFPVSVGIHFQSEKNSFPLQAFVPQPVRIGEAQFQNRPVVFPQFTTADLTRFQMQSPWQGLNPNVHPRHRQETLPPDLNIGFPPSGSPVRQTSGVLVDSQQPDLALQL